jgi:hypothetical protein
MVDTRLVLVLVAMESLCVAAPGDTAGSTYSSQTHLTATGSPSIYIDSLASAATISGSTTVSGWAIDNTSTVGPAISSVQIQVDGSTAGTAAYGANRADVCTAYPGRAGCPNVGFSYQLNAAALGAGSHTITAIATAADGSTGSYSMTVKVLAAPPPSVYIDSLAPGATVTGTVTVSGWAIDNITTIGTAISKVQILVDGSAVGSATYGGSRSDVCTVYPGRVGCPNVGFTYQLNTASLSSGSHTLTAIANDTNSTPESGSYSMIVKVGPQPLPSVYIDSLASGATVSGTVTISGWAIDSVTTVGSAIGQVQIQVDGSTVGSATFGGSRSDVCAAYPGRPGCPNVGFTYQLNTGSLSAGTHAITAVATDTDSTPDSGSYSIAVKVLGPSLPSVSIDSPASGATISGTATISGWAIDNTTSIGTAINSVRVVVDGATVGAATYGGIRSDVCTAYPGRVGCPNVGFTYQLNTTSLSAGTHTITVVASDSDSPPDSGSNSVTVKVPAQPISLTLTGPSVCQQGQTCSYTAVAGTPPYTYSLVSGSIGSVNPTIGAYTAPAHLVPQQTINGCQAFPNNSVFNTRIDSLPVNPNSASWVAQLTSPYLYYEESGIIPGSTVLSTDAPKQVTFSTTPQANGPFIFQPFPTTVGSTGTAVPGGYVPNRDLQIFTTYRDNCKQQEVDQLYETGILAASPGSNSQAGVIYDLNSFAHPGWGIDAAGTLMSPLSVHLDELVSAEAGNLDAITHAVAVTQMGLDLSSIWPAQGSAGTSCAGCIPHGARFRLRAGLTNASTGDPVAWSYDGACLTTGCRNIVRALLRAQQNYGFFVIDGPVSGEVLYDCGRGASQDIENALWEMYYQQQFSAANFEAVDESMLQTSRNATGPDPRWLEVKLNNGYVTPGNAAVLQVSDASGNTASLSVALQPVLIGVQNPIEVVMAGASPIQFSPWVTGSSNTGFTCTLSPSGGAYGTITSGCSYTPPSTSAITARMDTTVTVTASADPVATKTFHIAILPLSSDSAMHISLGKQVNDPFYTDTAGVVWWNDQPAGQPLALFPNYSVSNLDLTWSGANSAIAPGLYTQGILGSTVKDLHFPVWVANGDIAGSLFLANSAPAANQQAFSFDCNASSSGDPVVAYPPSFSIGDTFIYGGSTSDRSVGALDCTTVVSNGKLQMVARWQGINPGTDYICATNCYHLGGQDGVGVGALTIHAFSDTQAPPIVFNVAVTQTTNAGASTATVVITWGTDKPSDGQVFYGTTASYGIASPLVDSSGSFSQGAYTHSVVITGLSFGQTYHFAVQSRDILNPQLSAETVDQTFMAAAGAPPLISAVSLSSITNNSVAISWTTDKPSSSQVQYWGDSTPIPANMSPLNAQLVTRHRVVLSGLPEGTSYGFQVMSTDALGDQAISSLKAFSTIVGTHPIPVVSYDMLNGMRHYRDYMDKSYNGLGNPMLPATPLSGGSGELTDGQTGLTNWLADLGNGQAYEWVGWAINDFDNDPIDYNDSFATITFKFAQATPVGSVSLFVNNELTGDVEVFAKATITFSNDNTNFGNPVVYTSTAPDRADTTAHYLTIPLNQTTPYQYVRIHLEHQSGPIYQTYFPGEWLFISEVTFDSAVFSSSGR